MKYKDLLPLSTEELIKKDNELREDNLRLRFKLSTMELENTCVLSQNRKTIARIQTILNQRNGDK